MQPERPFGAPWEARAFALAVGLADKGAFEWREFAVALGAEIKMAEAARQEQPYYRLWLRALERVLAGKNLVSPVVVEAREAAVRESLANVHGGRPTSGGDA